MAAQKRARFVRLLEPGGRIDPETDPFATSMVRRSFNGTLRFVVDGSAQYGPE